MTGKMDLNENGSNESILRHLAEGKLSRSPDTTQELKEKTPEEIIHELHVHQIEMEMQNEELKRVQRELEESRSNYRGKYQELYDFAPVGYFTLTRKGLITEVNLTGATLLGMPRPKLIKRGFGHFVSPKSLDLWDKHIISVLGHEEKQTCDLRLIREDESTFYARINSIRIVVPDEWKGETGETHLIHMAVTDVTDWMWAEKELRESEERYRTVADFTYDWEYWVDPEGNFLYCSPSCERITGYSAKEFIDDPDLMNRIIHPDDRTEMLDHYHKVRKVTPDAVNAIDFRIIRRDGATRWIGHVCQPVYDQKGQISGRRAGNRDITELTQAQLRLEKERAHLRTLVQTIPDLIWLKNPDGVYLTCNSRFERFFGAKEAEIAGKTDYDFVDADLADSFREHDRIAMAAGKPSINEEWVTCADDGHRELLETIKTPMHDSDGSLIGVLGIARDITAARKAEETEKRLATAIEHTAEGIVITDAAGIIQYVNPAEEIISGYSSDELIGQGADIFKSDKHPADFHTNMWATITAGKVWSGRFINKKKDGTEYHEDSTISPVYDKSGKLTNFIAVKHDVTQKLALQEQLFQAQKMEAIGTLTGGFAHDFNNKLQVIDGCVELILFNKDLQETIKPDLETIKQAINICSELIKGMMVFSRKTPVEFQPIELNKIVAQTRSMLTRSIPKMIEIDLLLADDLWTINASASQIDQILMNLAVNASDAMPDGGRLTIQTQNMILDDEFLRPYPHAKPGRYVLFSVTDSGTGMEKETVKHIFEPFFTTKESDKGTGLGLAVVYRIVEQHGGRIICDSEPSVGTTFSIYFPAIEEVPQEQYSEKKEPPRGQGETILLVDDEPSFLEIVSRQLTRYNYKIITALNGKEALELYEKHREEIKLIILDLMMPAMGGAECLQTLLTMDPKIRVLIVSGGLKPGMADELIAEGAKGSVEKPFDMNRILEKIRKVIDES
jgi:PAS domain S-box-containing protein